jgi:hemerythrin-like domain-containing protein
MLRDPSLIPLSRQHQHALALCVTTERALRENQSTDTIARLSSKAIDHYDLELTNHFEMEERIVFPAMAAHPLIHDLVEQHRGLEGMIAALRARPSREGLLEFTALLRSHIRLEENELFQDIQSALPRETLDSIGKEIEQRVVRICH